MYTVKNVAELLEMTEHAVRFYTNKGLVPTLQRDINNKRIFNENSLRSLRGAKYLKKCGMSLEDIKKYVDLTLKGDSTLQDRYELILKQHEEALFQLEETRIKIDLTAKKLRHYQDIINKVN